MAEIAAETPSAASRFERDQQVARAAAEIQGAGLGTAQDVANFGHGAGSPVTIDVEREQVIGEIVAVSDASEHVADPAGRLFFSGRPSGVVPLVSLRPPIPVIITRKCAVPFYKLTSSLRQKPAPRNLACFEFAVNRVNLRLISQPLYSFAHCPAPTSWTGEDYLGAGQGRGGDRRQTVHRFHHPGRGLRQALFMAPRAPPTGTVVTRYWPMDKTHTGESTDHPHHRGLWFGQDEVNGFNFWAERAVGELRKNPGKQVVKNPRR